MFYKGVFLEIRKRPFLLGVVKIKFLSKTLFMKKNETNKMFNLATQKVIFRGTNRGVHSHFHAG